MAYEDSLGRTVDFGDKTMAEIKKMIASMMQGNVGSNTKEGTTSNSKDDAIKTIAKLLEELNQNIGKEFEQTKNYLDQIVKAATSKGEGKKSSSADTNVVNSLESLETDIGKMATEALTKGSLYVADFGTHKLLQTLLQTVHGITGPDTDVTAAIAQMKVLHDASPTSGLKDVTEASSSSSRKSASIRTPDLSNLLADVGIEDASNTIANDLSDALKRNSGNIKKALVENNFDGIDEGQKKKLISRFNAVTENASYALDGFGKSTLGLFEDISQNLQSTMFGLGKDGKSLSETLFGGLIKDQVKFMRDSRKVAYEVAGITGETKGLQKEFSKLEQSAYLTGFGREEMQEAYLKNMKSGIKNIKTAKDLSVAQLQVENQLGFAAGDLADNFRELNLSGRMSVTQIADMGRGMKEVARNTGISEEALKSAVNDAREFTKMMAKSSTLTAASANNITQVLASSQKLGVSESAKELLQLTTSSSKLMEEGGSKMKNLLLNAAASVGKMADLQNGVLTRSKAGIKDLRKGMENMLKSFGVESLDAIDQMSDQAKMALNVQLKAAFGVELGEMRNQIDALSESEKGLADKMVDINKKRQGNLTLEEKAATVTEERNLKINASLGALTALGEAAKGAKDMNQALNKFGERKGEFESDIKALGGDFKDAASASKTALTSAIENVNAGLKKAGKAEMQISSDEISKALKDPTALREMTAKITQGNQELETAQKAAVDPMTSVEQSFREYNDKFASYSSDAISLLTNLVGKNGMMIGALGTIGTEVLASSASLTQRLGAPLAGIKGFFTESVKQKRTPGSDGQPATGWVDSILGALKDTAQVTLSSSFDMERLTRSQEEAALAAQQLAQKRSGLGGGGSIGDSIMDSLKDAITPPIPPPGDTSGGVPPSPIPPTPSDTGFNALILAALMPLQNIDTAMELIMESIGAISSTIKSNHIQVTLDAKLYKFWKFQDKLMLKKLGVLYKTYIKDMERIFAGIAAPAPAPAPAEAVADKIPELTPPDPAGKAEESASEAITPPKSGLLDFLKDSTLLQEAGAALLKYGPMLAILAAGLIAVATAIIAVMDQVFKYTGIDVSTAVATATTIGVILGAVAAIAIATIESYKALAQLKGVLSELKVKDALIVGVKLVALAIALSGLAIGLIWAIKTMTEQTGLNLMTVGETAINIGAVIGAVAVIGKAVKEGIPVLIEFGPVLREAQSKAKDIAIGAAALLILTPILLVLALAVLWICNEIAKASGIDFNKAVEIGYTVGAILGVTALIAGAVIGAMYGLAGLGMLVPLIWANYQFLLLGAAALLLLTPVVLTLALTVLFMCNEIAKAARIDFNKAIEIGYTVVGILGATALIAGAIIGAMFGLAALGKLAIMYYTFGGVILLGAAALLLFTPIILTLALTVLSMCNEISKAARIDFNKAIEIGYTVVGILGATALIAVAIIGAMFGLAALGKLVPLIWKYKKPILKGAIALLVFTPLVVMLGLSLLYMCNEIAKSTGINAGKANEIMELITVILFTVGKMALMLISGLLELASLGGMAVLMFWAIPLIWLGIGAFKSGMSVFGELVFAVNSFAETLMNKGLNLDTLETINIIISAMGEIFKGIATTLNIFSDEVLPLFNNSYIFFDSAAENIREIIPDMQKSFAGIVAFFNDGIIGSLKELPSISTMEYISELLATLPPIFSAIALVMNTMTNELVPLFNGFLFFDSAAENIREIIIPMQNSFVYIVDFFNDGFIKSLKELPSISDMEYISELLALLPPIFSAIASVMNTITNELVPLFNGFLWFDSAAKDIQQIIDPMKASFAGIIGLFNISLLPSLKELPSPATMEYISESLAPMPLIFSSIASVIKSMANELVPLFTDGIFFNSAATDIKNAIPNMREGLIGVFQFIDEGIIDPIFENIGNPRDVKIAADALASLAIMIPLIPPVVNSISNELAPLVKTNYFSKLSKLDKAEAIAAEFGGKFEGICRFIDEGIINPIFNNIGNPRDVKIAAEALENVSKMLPLIPEVIKSISKNLAPLIEGNSITNTTKLKNAEKLTKDIGGNFTDICKFIDEAIINPIFNNIGNPRDVKIAAEALENVSKMLPLIPESLAGIDKHLGPLTRKGLFGGGQTKLEKLRETTDLVGTQLTDIFRFVDKGIVSPIFENIGNPNDLKVAGEALKSTNELLKILPDNINQLAKNLTPLSASIMNMSKVELPDVDQVTQMMDKFGASTQMIVALPDILIKLNDGMSKINDLQIGFDSVAVGEKVTNLLNGISQFITNGLNPQVVSAVATQIEKAAADLKIVDNGFKDLVASLTSIEESMKAIGTIGGNLAGMDMSVIGAKLSAGLQKVGVAASTAMNSVGPQTNNVQTKLEMKDATAPTSTNIASSDLSELNSNSAKELTINEQMKELLTQILASLQPKGGAPAAESSYSSVTKSADSFRLTTGRFSESSSIGVTNLD